jgi:hypothetical protein
MADLKYSWVIISNVSLNPASYYWILGISTQLFYVVAHLFYSYIFDDFS